MADSCVTIRGIAMDGTAGAVVLPGGHQKAADGTYDLWIQERR